MINKMRFASVTVTDIDKAVDFYVSVLGFSVVIEMPLPGGNRFVMVAPPGGGSNLVFSLPMPGRTHAPSAAIAFETGDVKATFDELSGKGVEFSRPPVKTAWGGVEATFLDPFGNSYMLQQGGPLE